MMSRTIFTVLFTFTTLLNIGSCKYIKRTVKNRGAASPSTDSFDNPTNSFHCSQKKSECERRNATCWRPYHCCQCKCSEDTSLFSTNKGQGCLNTAAINSAARCSFALTNFTRTIPAFSSYRLLQNSKFTLESKLSNFSNVLKTGRCTAKSIHYINDKGEPKKIFDNECSETMAIFSKKSPSNEIIHQLSWTHTAWFANAAWQKMQGKLLKIDISCRTSNPKSLEISSCLLFKVSGRYNVLRNFPNRKSNCPKTTNPPTVVKTKNPPTVVKKDNAPTTDKFKVTTTQRPSTLPKNMSEVGGIFGGFTKAVSSSFPRGHKNHEDGSSGGQGTKKKELDIEQWMRVLISCAVSVLVIALIVTAIFQRRRCQKQRLSSDVAQVAFVNGSQQQINIADGATCGGGCDPDENIYETIDSEADDSAKAKLIHQPNPNCDKIQNECRYQNVSPTPTYDQPGHTYVDMSGYLPEHTTSPDQGVIENTPPQSELSGSAPQKGACNKAEHANSNPEKKPRAQKGFGVPYENFKPMNG